MIRHCLKMMLMALLVLIQTACPKYATQQQTESAPPDVLIAPEF